jgi:hypothetical protein
MRACTHHIVDQLRSLTSLVRARPQCPRSDPLCNADMLTAPDLLNTEIVFLALNPHHVSGHKQGPPAFADEIGQALHAKALADPHYLLHSASANSAWNQARKSNYARASNEDGIELECKHGRDDRAGDDPSRDDKP